MPVFGLCLNVNLVDESINTIMKNTESVLIASKEVGTEINVEKLKCSCHKLSASLRDYCCNLEYFAGTGDTSSLILLCLITLISNK